MNYFNRKLPNKNKLENCLENISKEVDTYLKQILMIKTLFDFILQH